MAGYKDPKLTSATILSLKPAIDWCIEQHNLFGAWPKFATIGQRFGINRTKARHAVHLADKAKDGHDIYPSERPDGIIFFALSSKQCTVKIGYSAANLLQKRFRDLQEGNSSPLTIIATMTGTIERRNAIHQQFNNLALERSWFQYEEPLISFIRESS